MINECVRVCMRVRACTCSCKCACKTTGVRIKDYDSLFTDEEITVAPAYPRFQLPMVKHDLKIVNRKFQK